MLLTNLDSPHETVRAAVRGSLEEFSFERYQSAFDMLDDLVRKTTGAVVRKVDLRVPQRLQEELQARSRTRRLRGIAMAASMNVVPDLENAIIERLSDEDHLVRAEAAKALAVCKSAKAQSALRRALSDRSIAVQEAAEWSLQDNELSLVSEQLAAAILADEADQALRETVPIKTMPGVPAADR